MRASLLVLVACGGSPPPVAARPPAPAVADTRDAERGEHGHADEAREKEPAPVTIPCPDAVASAAAFPPPLTDAADERAWLETVRRGFLLEECEHGWSDVLKSCLRDAGASGADVQVCLADHLAPDEQAEIARALADFDELAAKVVAAKREPRSIGCKQIVAHHYGDARWRTKLDGYPAAERKRLIAASRAKLTKACTEEPWPDTLRACIVAGGEDTCFQSFGMTLQWGYPAAGVVSSLGVAECDAYGAAVMKLAGCAKIPESSRAALVRSFEETRARVAALPAAERKKQAPSCTAGLDAIAAVAQSAGC